MRKSFNIGTILLLIIELSFVVFLPIPAWLKIIILFILGFISNFMPFVILPVVVAGWVWAYIYIWHNIQNTGYTIFFMIMLLFFGADIWLTKTVYQKMPSFNRPLVVTTKRFSIEMWSIAICAFLADIAMLIHLIVV